jgi:hypothetical protein
MQGRHGKFLAGKATISEECPVPPLPLSILQNPGKA